MMVATFAVIRDLYSGDDCAKMYSLLNSIISLSPLVAPVISGYLAFWFGWRACFFFLAILAFLIVILSLTKLNETLLSENKEPLSKQIFAKYLTIIKSRRFQMYTFCAATGFACFLTFFSVSSYVIINLPGVAEQHFGFYFGGLGIVFFFSSLLSAYSSKKFGTYTTVLLGTVLTFSAGLIMLVWYLIQGLSMAEFMGPMFIMSLGGAFLMGGGAGGAIEPFPTMAGAASAVFGRRSFCLLFLFQHLFWSGKLPLPFHCL